MVLKTMCEMMHQSTSFILLSLILNQCQVAAHYPWTSPAVDYTMGFVHGSSGYDVITRRQLCGGSLSLSVGVPSYITSPRYPEAYPPNIRCLWDVKAPFGTRISLYYEHLVMPSKRDLSADCTGDNIEIIDIHYTYRICSYQYGEHYVSVSSSLSVSFTSDRIREDYSASFRIRLVANRNDRPCDEDITVDRLNGRTSGEFKTPNFPRIYPSDESCFWRLRSPIGTRLTLQCDINFWLEPSDDCTADFLAISSNGNDAMKEATRYCGFNGPGTVTSQSNILTMLFHSNSQHDFSGFRCHYEISGKVDSLYGSVDSMIAGVSSNSVSVTTSPVSFTRFSQYEPSLWDSSTASSSISTSSWLCNCGMANKKSIRSARIVGGTQTQINAYPWVVAIFKRDGRQYCAGSLINDRYILTASHCVARLRPSDIHVSIGDHDLDISEESRHQIVKVRTIIVHPGYRSTPVETDDIALLELAQLVTPTMMNAADDTVGTTVRPVCLPNPASIFDTQSQTPIVVGWGKLSEAGLSTSVLRETALPIQPNIQCQKAYGFSVVTDKMICAGQPDGTADACQGDSGGPMMVVHQSRWYIIGLVSYGYGCSRREFPGVYTKIDRYLEWIRENTQGSPSCPQTIVGNLPPTLPQPSAFFANKVIVPAPAPMTPRTFEQYRWPWFFYTKTLLPLIRNKRVSLHYSLN